MGSANVHVLNWRHTGRFCVAAFSMDAANGMFFVALPYLALAFGADSMHLGVLTAVRGAAYVLACVPASMLSDRVNRKALVAFSGLGISLAFLSTVWAREYWHLCALTVLWALTISPFWPSLFSWVGDSHTSEQLGAATGAVNVSWSVGGMLGGLLAGWLFGIRQMLPFLIAVGPILIAASALLSSPCGHGKPQPTISATAIPGTRRELATVWLSNMAVCSMLGLMSGVFPRFGTEIGVDVGMFGLFMGGLGLGRSVVFFSGLRWGHRLHGWRLAMAAQLLAGGMVATTARTESRMWLAFVFLSVGIALGVNYYRGLYKSLETAGSRGLKSGLHEATLLMGILIGSLGGGALAKAGGLRAPYVPAGIFVGLLLILQSLLLLSVHRARKGRARVAAGVGAVR